MYVSMMHLAIVTTFWSSAYKLKLLLRPTYLGRYGMSSKTIISDARPFFSPRCQQYLLYTLDRNMATLDSLPTELLREILDCLRPVDELTFASRGVQVGTWTIQHCQRTLAAVARTCRRLNHVANDILYCRYEALYQEPAAKYIERFDTDPQVRRRLRHVKITKPMRDIFENGEGEIYEASQPRVRDFQKIFSQLDPFRYCGRTLEIVTKERPELVEVANLVIRAENLETLELEPPHLGVDHESPRPVPFFDSPFCLKEGFPSNPNLYSTLRSLTLDMNTADRPAMFMLLHFPALRELRLRHFCEWRRVPLIHGDGEMHEHSEVVAGASKVTTLELQDATTLDGELVLGMIESCKALERFLLSEKVKILDHEGVRQARPRYQSILNGLLKRHSASLKYLELSPDSTDPCIDRCSEDILTHRKKVLEYPRLEGFIDFTALEDLRVPMPLLTGRPKGESIGNTFEPETRTLSWGSYIDAERLLPPTLTKLSLTMGPVLSPALGWDYSDLLDFITRHNRITHLNVDWKYYMYQEQLPIDFYNLKCGRASFGCKFDYSIFVRNLSHSKLSLHFCMQSDKPPLTMEQTPIKQDPEVIKAPLMKDLMAWLNG
jgi:hypothetical protein